MDREKSRTPEEKVKNFPVFLASIASFFLKNDLIHCKMHVFVICT